MFEKLKIKLFTTQPAAKPSLEQVDKIVKAQFQEQFGEVMTILDSIKIDSPQAKNRIKVAVLKLADGKIDKLDKLVDKANVDFRDVIVLAEYPRNWKNGFDNIPNKNRKKEYLDDWNEYQDWLNSFE